MKRLLAITIIASVMIPCANAEEVVVIVNSANQQTLSKADIKNIYSDKIIHWADGKKVKLYNLPESSSAREVFSRGVLGVGAVEAAAAESNKKITNTIQNPSYTKRERLVVSIVSKRPTAIGYVSRKSIKGKSGLRVLLTLIQ